MPHLEITIFNQKLKLSYQENEKERLIRAIDALNQSWNKFSNLYGKVSDLKIITLISLELQDSIGSYEDEIKFQKKKIDILKKEIKEKQRDFQSTLEKVNKLKLEIDIKEKEISNTEIVLGEIHHELSQIKTNILSQHDE